MATAPRAERASTGGPFPATLRLRGSASPIPITTPAPAAAAKHSATISSINEP